MFPPVAEPAFAPSTFLSPFSPAPALPISSPRPAQTRMCAPLQDRLLRLSRALTLAVSQERFSDAASLRDALASTRSSDASLAASDALRAAIEAEDFGAAARLRDEIALLTEEGAKKRGGGRVGRIVVLRAQAEQPGRLRVATISRDGGVELKLEPAGGGEPRIYLQPCFSPSGDFVCCTEIRFKVIGTEGSAKVVSMNDSSHRVVILNAFDGTVVKAIDVKKPPFYYCWSPCGRKLSMLCNDVRPGSGGKPSVSMSAVQIVAPPGGDDVQLEMMPATPGNAVTDPAVTGHPVLYDFCPRDSDRVVAHVGDRSEVVIASLLPGRAPKVVSYDAGSFGTPQWHPLKGESGREVVLFVEGNVQAGEEEREKIRERKKVKEDVRKAIEELSRSDAVNGDGDEVDFSAMEILEVGDDDDDDDDSDGVSNIDVVMETDVKPEILWSKKLRSMKRVDINIDGSEKIGGAISGGAAGGLKKLKDDEFVTPEAEVEKPAAASAARSDENPAPAASANSAGADKSSDEEAVGSSGGKSFMSAIENSLRTVLQALPRGAIPGVETGKKSSAEKEEKMVADDELRERTPVVATPSKPEKSEAGSGSKSLKAPWGKDKDRDLAKIYMADVDNPEVRRCICACSGVVSFKLSPDGSALALLVNNPDTGEDELSICRGDFAPDTVLQDATPETAAEENVFVSSAESLSSSSSSSSSTNLPLARMAINPAEQSEPDVLLSTPDWKCLAFFWSPDSSKLLFLSSFRKSTVGTCRWGTFDLNTLKVAKYENFIASPMFAHSLTFFCSYSNSMTPWSPESDAFCYAGREMTEEEKKTGEAEDSSNQANAATLLTALMLQKKKSAESGKGVPFSACVQNVATLPVDEETGEVLSRKLIVRPPRKIMDHVELAAWSQC